MDPQENDFFLALSKAHKSKPDLDSHRTNRSEGADKSEKRRSSRQMTPLGKQLQKQIQKQVSRDLQQLQKDQKKMLET